MANGWARIFGCDWPPLACHSSNSPRLLPLCPSTPPSTPSLAVNRSTFNGPATPMDRRHSRNTKDRGLVRPPNDHPVPSLHGDPCHREHSQLSGARWALPQLVKFGLDQVKPIQVHWTGWNLCSRAIFESFQKCPWADPSFKDTFLQTQKHLRKGHRHSTACPSICRFSHPLSQFFVSLYLRVEGRAHSRPVPASVGA
jgi:hypothetical protein